MVFRISKILEKGKIVNKGLISILSDHEKRLEALEDGSSDDSDDESTGRTVKVTVVDSSENLVEMATVLITDAKTGEQKSGSTNKNGECTFSNIPDGEYDYYVGYKTGSFTGKVTVSKKNTNFTVTV